MKHNYIIHWEAWLVSGQERINPEPKDRWQVRCEGFLPMMADSELQARRSFNTAFPDDRIVSIK